MFREYPDILTVAQMAEALHIGKSAAYALISTNSIAHKRIGRAIRIPKVCLIDFVQSSRYNSALQR